MSFLCTQVSRAWRSLAEDEVLWLQLSHQYGYNMENKSTDDLNWKSIFREKQVRQQNLTANWKVCFKNFKKTPSHKILYHFFLSHRRACKRQHANKKYIVATSNAVKDTMLLNANTVQYRFYYTCILL